jgi:hypothetical protein
LDPGEGRGEHSGAEGQDLEEGALHEETVSKEEGEETAIKDEDEEAAQSPQGIVPTSFTTSPWSKIHGGICCELM